jgi:hypothetical protein
MEVVIGLLVEVEVVFSLVQTLVVSVVGLVVLMQVQEMAEMEVLARMEQMH